MGYEATFDRFWSAYPKKVDKKRARELWCKKLKPDETLVERIVAAVEQHKKSRQWKSGYIPNPTTYLNGERWEDELEVTKSKTLDLR